MDKKCELICKGIKDEEEGIKYYRELSKTLEEDFPLDSLEQATIFKARQDEDSHKFILTKFGKKFNCKCPY